MSLHPTASKSNILVNCSYAYDPRHDLEQTSGPGGLQSEPLRWGNAFHECIAVLLKGAGGGLEAGGGSLWETAALRWGPGFTPSELEDNVSAAYNSLHNWLIGNNPWGVNFRRGREVVEESYWLNPEGGAVGSCNLDVETHSYNNPEGTIPGTLDYASLTGPQRGRVVEMVEVAPGEFAPAPIGAGGGMTLVLDHKTGTAEDFSIPGEKEQLLTLAAMVDARIVAVLHATRRSAPLIYADEITDELLANHLKRMAAGMSRIGDGSMRPGHWCKYCPARGICPAKQGELLANATAIIRAHDVAVEQSQSRAIIPTGKRLGALHQLISYGNSIREEVRKYAKEYVKTNPGEVVVRPDGKVLEVKTVQRERLSKAGIIAALGREEGNKLLDELRAKGCLTTEEEEHLVASYPDE